MKNPGKPHLRAVSSTDTSPRPADIESMICDLYRSAHITFLMCMRDAEEGETNDPLGSLGMFMAEQTERLAKELRDAFYEADLARGATS